MQQNPNAPPLKMPGAPTPPPVIGAYRQEFDDIARVMSSMGAHTRELADAFGVSEIEILEWRSKIPSFNEAIVDGGQTADDRVRDSLYLNAVGGKRTKTVTSFYKGSWVTEDVQEYVPGDVRAQQYWLGNRDPENWTRAQRKDIDIRSPDGSMSPQKVDPELVQALVEKLID